MMFGRAKARPNHFWPFNTWERWGRWYLCKENADESKNGEGGENSE